MSFTVIIPARYESIRLPGKPLADINGKPMIQYVYERATLSEASDVIIATDNDEIKNACEGFGAKVCMTSTHHPSGTDRLQEVVTQLKLYADDIVVNVQGDEPLIPPRVINQVAHNLIAEQEASIATLCEKIESVDDLLNSNVVKVIMDRRNFAIYFSRAPIPWPRQAFNQNDRKIPEDIEFFRHVGIYGYRVNLLNNFVQWSPSPIELAECLEQLRAMWNGAKVHVAIADEMVPPGVDTPEDLTSIRQQFRGALDLQ